MNRLAPARGQETSDAAADVSQRVSGKATARPAGTPAVPAPGRVTGLCSLALPEALLAIGLATQELPQSLCQVAGRRISVFGLPGHGLQADGLQILGNGTANRSWRAGRRGQYASARSLAGCSLRTGEFR